jgi:hypothetical protein
MLKLIGVYSDIAYYNYVHMSNMASVLYKNMIAHNGYNKLVQPTKLDIHVSTVTAAMN